MQIHFISFRLRQKEKDHKHTDLPFQRLFWNQVGRFFIFCCCYSLYFSGTILLEDCCEDLTALSHKNNSKVRYRCWMISSGLWTLLKLIPNALDSTPSSACTWHFAVLDETELCCLVTNSLLVGWGVVRGDRSEKACQNGRLLLNSGIIFQWSHSYWRRSDPVPLGIVR